MKSFVSIGLTLGLGAGLLGAASVPPHRIPAFAPGAATMLSLGAAPAPRFRGARPSVALERVAGRARLLKFSSPIQHVVVIVMENRSVDNLFAGYYGQPFPGGGTWDQALNLYNPSEPTQPLTLNSLSASFDPYHTHDSAFTDESKGAWNKEKFTCPHKMCPPTATAYSYVPTMETDAYRQIITNWAFGNDVLQPNEGPSWPAHQYLIAGQSGGLAGALTAPYAQAENPGEQKTSDLQISEEQGDTPSPDVLRGTSNSFCGQTKVTLATLNMLDPYKQLEDANPNITPCEEYGANKLGTVLDEAVGRFGKPDFMAWQYIAHNTKTIWAAPLGVQHLFSAYDQAANKATEPFAVDPGAQQFVKDIASGAPSRPFAHLTYITPCYAQSDHPIDMGTAQTQGPEWLAYVVNAIGASKYWPNTTILVVWDDWGGFFDHVSPIHAFPNAYPVAGSPGGNPSDPNEYGFRVPLMVISPYVRKRAFVSSQRRSFSAILRYAEDTFNLPSLNADDAYNDNLGDMFDFTHGPLRYVPIVNVPAPTTFC